MGSIPITRSIIPPAATLSGPALSFGGSGHYMLRAILKGERKQMSRKATQRLSFFLLMGLTLYASFVGAG
ncbi:hypothetical protein RM190_16725 [Paracoccus sp. CPCC 101403]|uniref:Uncharacterized protein n=2 Tax=Paracoccus broussonetiae TaxID=3075834 RepID=A0ABU3EHB8_9RHOB|nr:hypothetical protein [Paracoccus sp. CPCC 101403]MDT1063520.1 hypothetical protein [Paracoccus sp. CPCC 101403]